MITEKGKKELTTGDYKVLSEILTKAPGVLSPEERAHLVARRGYLTEDTLKEYKIKGGEKSNARGAANPEDTDPADNQSPTDYSGMKKGDLLLTCEERNIEVDKGETKDGLIEILEADDRGELEDDDEGEGEK